jgi:hypothetical protein
VVHGAHVAVARVLAAVAVQLASIFV